MLSKTVLFKHWIFNLVEIASARFVCKQVFTHSLTRNFQRCPLDKLLMLAAKSQTSLDFARLHVTFRPWRRITFCNEKARRIVILNTAPAGILREILHFTLLRSV